MKKLLIAVSAAACALGAFAAKLTEDSKVTFEEAGYEAGKDLVVTNDDAGVAAADSGKGQWYSASPAEVDATVTAYATEGKTGNYLNIESTGKPLYRLIHGMATPDVAGADTETMGEVYIDTMVQFTAGDPDMTSDEDGAKLALWVCGNEENGDPATTTNFMVKAGCFDKNGFTNGVYTMAADGVTFEKDAWYRLTVKSLKDVYTDDQSTPYHGFVVFVDGEMLKPQSYTLPEGVSVADKFKDGLVLSMVADNPLLAAVGFSGTGAIDDVTFTASAPDDFAADEQVVTLTWTDGVTSLVYGDWSTNDVTEAGSAKVPFDADATVTVTYATDYMAGTPDGELAVGGTYNVVAVPVAAVVGGTQYATLQAAIDAANGNTVVLKGNATFEYDGEAFAGQLVITNTVTLDLAGHEILPKVAEGLVITVGETGSLTITNSTETVGYVRGTIENGGADANALTLVGGKYLTSGLPQENYVVPAPFEAKELTDADAGYTQIVVATEEPEPTVITITFVNGETSETVEANADGKVTAPSEGEKTGYTFAGWFADDAEVATDLATAVFTEDTRLTAHWTANTYTVTFYTNDVVYATANYTYAGSDYSAPADPVVDGYTFDGWYADAQFETAFTFDATVAGNTQVAYAKLTVVTPPAPEETFVTPGSEGATVTAESADAAKDAVTITVPTDINATDYRGLFDKVATDNGDGTWTVTAELNTDAETAIKADADAVVKTVDLTAAAAVTADGTLAPIAAEELTPGIYYSVEVADNLGFENAQEGGRVMAGADGKANIPMPNPKALENANGNARFFRVKADVKGDK